MILLINLLIIGLGLFWFMSTNAWGLIPLGFGLILLALGIKFIPADPPHKGIMTRFGKRTNVPKDEGLRYVIPLIDGIIPVNVKKKNYDLPTETVRTPDLAELEIPISLTWTPHEDYLIEYLNSGGEEGVNNILSDVVRERVRGWAMNHQEGPQTFKEALGAKEDAVEILIKAVSGKEIGRIPSRIPTTTLFHYFNEPQIPPTEKEEEIYGKNCWKKIKKIIDSEDKENKEKDEEIPFIKEAIDTRREQVKEIQRGNGVQVISKLGITLNRLNIGDIAIKKGSLLDQAAEKEIKEESEKAAETVELKHVGVRIAELMGEPWNYTKEQARDIVQTERDKVTKKIYDVQGLKGLGKGIGEVIGETLKRR